MSEPYWQPDPSAVADTNLGRFMEVHGIAAFDDLLERSTTDPEWFWAAVADFLGIPFSTPWERVLDLSDGVPWARWFSGGQTNLAAICVDRWVTSTPEVDAVVWEGEDGVVRTLTYSDLGRHVDGLARRLTDAGIGPGDAVGIFLPMLPETVVAAMAVAKVGAVFLPIFSGYGVEAITVRLADAEARALLCADGFLRRGEPVPMLDTARDAASRVAGLETVLVVPRLADPADLGLRLEEASEAQAGAPGSDGPVFSVWPGPLGPDDDPVTTLAVDTEHPLFIAYTSGTTGRPKGAVHVHGGFTVKIAEEAAFQFDCRPGDRLFWFADFGWIMGPWEIVGALSNGATVCLYEGAPDFPDVDRLWSYVEDHAVTILGISPTLVRALMGHGAEPVARHDLSSLRILGSTGEPWNEGPYRWFAEVVGGGRLPIINISGGTEVGACFLSPHPITPIDLLSLGGPALGMAIDVFDEEGRPVRDEVGELVCTAPWPGMTRGLWRDPDRYLDTYWSRWPDIWHHGDWAIVEGDQWYLRGRSDDTITIAGKRLGPAEVESALVGHPAVAEAAAIGVPDDIRGQALWCYVVPAPGVEESEELRAQLDEAVTIALGRSFRPARTVFVDALPKTRSAKVLRRAIRAAALGADPGDLSSLEDPTAIDAVAGAR